MSLRLRTRDTLESEGKGKNEQGSREGEGTAARHAEYKQHKVGRKLERTIMQVPDTVGRVSGKSRVMS